MKKMSLLGVLIILLCIVFLFVCRDMHVNILKGIITSGFGGVLILGISIFAKN